MSEPHTVATRAPQPHNARTTLLVVIVTVWTTSTVLVAPRPVAVAGNTAAVTVNGPPPWATIIHRPPIYDRSVLTRTI